MPRITVIPLLLCALLVLSSCAESAHQVLRNAELNNVPPELGKQIDSSVAFTDLRAAPGSYVGRVIMVGGVVISAKRKEDRTEIEVLQLPTEAGAPSTTERLRSEGRFLAVREEFLDPATVPPGTLITVVGVVSGSMTRPLDDREYTYPVLDIKHLTDWSAVASQQTGGTAGAFYGPYYSPFGYWGTPYGYNPYFGRPYPYFIQPRPPSPSFPPQHSAPPRFRKGR
ncbi:MAG TPA: Slp family lipoprotein [Nitrospiraceae bacterium]|nr:Slp family lipoprotein [Nitrospiraceae bacterium]